MIPLIGQEAFVQAGGFTLIAMPPVSHSSFMDMPEKTAESVISFMENMSSA